MKKLASILFLGAMVATSTLTFANSVSQKEKVPVFRPEVCISPIVIMPAAFNYDVVIVVSPIATISFETPVISLVNVSTFESWVIPPLIRLTDQFSYCNSSTRNDKFNIRTKPLNEKLSLLHRCTKVKIPPQYNC